MSKYRFLMGGAAAAINGRVLITPTSSLQSTVDGSSFTFAKKGIGSPSATRTVIVAGVAYGSLSGVVSSIVSPTSADLRVNQEYLDAGTGLYMKTFISTELRTTGTGIDITVTFPVSVNYCAGMVFAMRGHSSAIPDDTDFATDTNPITLNPNCPEGSVAVAIGLIKSDVAATLSVSGLNFVEQGNDVTDTTYSAIACVGRFGSATATPNVQLSTDQTQQASIGAMATWI